MFGFVRPAACRSSAPRSVTDGCPYPPLPRRAKNRNKIQLFSHRKQEISENGGDFFIRCTNSFHRPRGGPPPSRREVLGVRRSRPAALPSIAYRGFAVAPITLRAPPIFCKLSIFPSPRPPSSREGDRPQAVEGVSGRWKAYMSHLTPSVTAAPCQTFGVPLACLPHSGRQAPRPQRGSSLVGLFPA